MRRLLDIHKDDSVAAIVVDTVALVLFTLLGLCLIGLLLGVIGTVVYLLVEGAVT